MAKVPLMAEFPMDKVKIEVAELKLTLAAVRAPPETVTPAPAPMLNVPVPVKPPAPVKFMAVVGVKVPVAVAVGTVKVPEVWVNPPLKTNLEAVVRLLVIKEPVLVTSPPKELVAVLLLSVKIPALVKAPVTSNAPVVLTVNWELAAVLRVPLIVGLPAERVRIEVAVFRSTLAAANVPTETVTPSPAPIVNVPVPISPPVPTKFMAVVGVRVPEAVAVGTVNVPDV